MSALRRAATGRLFDHASQHEHPSSQVLDRIESSLRSQRELEGYAGLLLGYMQNQRHPSLRLLDRLDLAAARLERLQARRRQAANHGQQQSQSREAGE